MAAPSSLTGILSLLPSVSAPSKPTVPTITTPVAPPWRDTTPKTATPSRSSATRERVNPTITVSAAGTRAPLVYGRGQVPAHVATVVVYQNKLYLDIVWALGEINAIESIANPESGLVAGTYAVTHYLGTSSQGVDPWLAAAISGYADTLRGTVQGRAASFAHSVVRVDSLSVDLSKAFLGTLEGRLLYDPRIPGDAYSSNAALVLADALVLGGETVDWAGSEDAFDFCDESVGGAPRWTCNLVIEDPEEVPDLIEELRAYAHCLVVPGPDGVRLIPDAAVASTTAVGVADIQEGSLEIRRRSRRETPTVVRVKYTRTDTTPWSDATAEARLASVDAGTESWRESNISLPGIHTYAEANRTAIERLNAYNLRDLEGQAVLFDSALAHTPGDVLAITHPIGLTGKLMRVLGMDAAEPGRWAATLEEYDPAVYTNSIQSEPTYGDTTLSSPFTVPEITGLAAAEEPYQLENGTFATRFRISWSDADYLYQHKYVVRVTTGGQLVTSGTPAEALWVTGPLQEGNVYKVSVAILAELVGLTGEATEATITAQGKGLIPGNVTGFTGFEVGGEVRLSWNQVIDDVWRYEVRYGTTSTDWDDMNVIDQVDALRLVSKDTPAGTWKFAVKAIDSIGQYSTTEATRTITVTLDKT